MTGLERQREDRRSTRNHHAETKPKVTAEKLRELRADGIPWVDIAQRYGRNADALKAIMSGRKNASRG